MISRTLFHCSVLVAFVVSLLSASGQLLEPENPAPLRPFAEGGLGKPRSSGPRTTAPERLGFDSDALADMFDYVRSNSVPVHSVQIARHDRLLLDSYIHPYRVEWRHDVASVTESITSTLIGLAVQKGSISSVTQSVVSFFPAIARGDLDPRKRRKTIEDLLTMRAGWDCSAPLEDPNVQSDLRFFQMRRSADWVNFALNLPMVAEPGTVFAYCNLAPHVLSGLITQVTRTNALGFAKNELFGPLGIKDVSWPADRQGNNYGWGDLQLHPRDMVKLGQILLKSGRNGDRQIVPESWIRTATSAHVEQTGTENAYGFSWWVKLKEHPDMFEAVGRGGQRIVIWPAKDIVVVFTGGGFDPAVLGKFILKALKSDDPLPANPEAFERLMKLVAAAALPPPAKPVQKEPALAHSISGKVFKFSDNMAGLRSLALKFNDSSEAQAELSWGDQLNSFRVSLDGSERFSRIPISTLPVAGTGQWLSDNTFLLNLDLVGGINFYSFKLMFSSAGRVVDVALNERTGLYKEKFNGKASP